ncbi:MAG: preprotein translocase subunit YajC [Alphaproteobacteria bacterium]|nr:preprotein translocase subunit YajC [Alphaproteobacteria bacterium]
MFISPAFAQTVTTAGTAAPQGSMWSLVLQFGLILAIIYFIIIRPQQKRFKKHEAELNAIVKGVRINVSGIVGKVVEVEPLELTVEIAPDVKIKVLRPYVSQVFFNEDELLKKKEG